MLFYKIVHDYLVFKVSEFLFLTTDIAVLTTITTTPAASHKNGKVYCFLFY